MDNYSCNSILESSINNDIVVGRSFPCSTGAYTIGRDERGNGEVLLYRSRCPPWYRPILQTW